jgi:hypothetical protein
MRNYIRNFTKFTRLNENTPQKDFAPPAWLPGEEDDIPGDMPSYKTKWSQPGDTMKVFILVLSQDITNTSGDLDQFIKVSRNREELETLMEEGNSEINGSWDPEWMEWDGLMTGPSFSPQSGARPVETYRLRCSSRPYGRNLFVVTAENLAPKNFQSFLGLISPCQDFLVYLLLLTKNK